MSALVLQLQCLLRSQARAAARPVKPVSAITRAHAATLAARMTARAERFKPIMQGRGGITVGAAARAAGMAPQNARNMLRSLVKDGVVVRVEGQVLETFKWKDVKDES